MSRRSRLGAVGLLIRHETSSIAPSILVASLIALVVLVVALAPRALSMLATTELRHQLGELSALASDIGGERSLAPPVGPPGAGTAIEMFAEVDAAIARLDDQPRPLAGIMGDPEWYLSSFRRPAVSADATASDRLVEIALTVDLAWEDRVRFVDGAAPSVWTGDEADDLLPEERPPLEIALSAAAAEVMDVGVGDVLSSTPAPLRVSGIYEPADPDDPYWAHAFLLHSVVLTPPGPSDPGRILASAYVASDSALRLVETLEFAGLTAWVPIIGDELDYADAALVSEQVSRMLGRGLFVPQSQFVILQSGLVEEIEEVTARVTSLSALLALAASGALGVAIAVFALGVRTVLERRRSALALAAARGAGSLQLRGVMFVEGLLLAGPASALGIGLAAYLLPARVGPEATVVPVLVGLSVPVLFASITSPRGLRSTRSDLAIRSRSRIRWIVEVAVIGVAALSLFLLARRGLVASSEAVGIDPLLVAAPLLLAAAACILVLRLYPYPVLALQRAMRLRRDVVGLLGAARAIRDPALGFAATLALVIGVSVAVFSAVMSTTIATSLAVTARQAVGAEVRIEASRIGADAIDGVRAVPGVLGIAPIEYSERLPLGEGFSAAEVTVVFTDTDGLREIHPALPRALDELRDGRIPLVVSADLADRTYEETTIADQQAIIEGTMPSESIPRLSRSWVVVDVAFRDEISDEELHAQILLLAVEDGHDVAATGAAAGAVVAETQREGLRDDVEVIDVQTELARARTAPLVWGLEGALQLGLLLSGALCAVTIVLASVSAAPRRNRTVGVLRTLGMSPRQTGGLIGWEIGPVVLTAAVAGTLVGLALPWLVTTALDLRPFVGGFDAPTPAVDAVLIGGVLVGFAAVASAAALVATVIGRRLHPAGILKMGTE